MASKRSPQPLMTIPKAVAKISRHPLVHQGNQLRKNAVAAARSVDLINWNGTPYGEHPTQVLDIQEVNDLCPRDGWPTVLLIHGGGWVRGDKEQFKALMPLFTRKRIMPVAMNYRLAPEHPWPSQLEDVHLAIDFLKSQQVDLQRIALWGTSVGGQLALLAALQRDDICAVVSFGAPTDIRSMKRDEWQLCLSEEDLIPASPIHQENCTLPPTFMVHGELDQVIPASNCTRFAEQHTTAQATIVAGGNHGLQWPPFKTRTAKKQAFQWLIDTMDLPTVGSKWKRRKKKK